ncbi:MAG: AMP-binding protein [Deltaproteobacteria bacterium]|nr:AMP-binding protein [Deltaproteobacteria bacterium]
MPFSALWLDLEGSLTEEALRAAAAQVIARHPMLRLRPGREDEALSVDADRAPWIAPLPAEDVLEPLRAPLPMERGPLILRLLQTPAGPRLLLLVHHLVGDGWSLQVIAQELMALLSGATLPAPSPSSFADWTRWEAGQPPPPPAPPLQAPALPWEGPGEGRVCARFLAIDVAATRRLKDEAAALGVTFAARVLAAWTHALGQWSGHEEVVVKVAEARRDAPLPGLEGVVGCFADTTPLRLPTRGGVEALSRAVHQRLAARPPSRSSLDQPNIGPAPGFSFARFPSLSAPSGPIRVIAARGATATRATRLALAVWEHEGALGLSFTWPEDLLSDATIHSLGASVLEALTAWPVDVFDGDDTPAVLGDEPWGHRRLQRAARALALAFADEGPVIAARLHQGPVALAALLATQLTGRAWMPLSPDDPLARVEPALAAAGSPKIYEEQHLRRLLSGPTSVSDQAPKSPWAAILLTSGTTGAPRAVPIRREALEAYLTFAQARFGLRPDDRCLAAAPLSFDASLRQLLAPIRAGAAVLPAPPRLTRDPEALAEAIVREGITLWSSVPSLFRLVESRLGDHSLRIIQLGGEALPADLARRWAGRARLFNLYGPTETTINATTFEVPPGFDGDELPLGEPWPGVQLCVVNAEGEAAEDGELLIGGVGLADEALGLTHARINGAPWHRSGDRVVRVGGALLYRGRLDRQLKLRGQRVEAGEIEAALRQLPGVHDAVAIVIDGALWGVVEGALPEDAAARLGERLPASARPRLVVVSPLPRTTRGKVDEGAVRERLAAQLKAEEAAQQGAQTTGDDWPARLRAAWTATLGGPPRSDDDDFFASGGDSLAALRLFEHLKPPPGLRPLTIYRCPRFGAYLMAVTASAAAAPPGLAPERLQGPVPPVVAGFLLAEALDPSRPAQWSARFTLRGRYTDEAVQAALGVIFARHPTLRARIIRAERGFEWLEGPTPQAPPVLSLVGLPQEEQIAALRARQDADAHTPLELSEAGVRVSLRRLSKDELVILLLAHHGLADGWSVEVIAEELLQTLNGEPLPAPPSLAPLTQAPPPLGEDAHRHWAKLFARPAPALPAPAGLMTKATARWPRRVGVGGLLAKLTGALGGPVEIGVAISGRDGASARLVGPLASMIPVRVERPEDATSALHDALAHAPGPGQLIRAFPGLSPSRAIGAAVSVTVIEQAERKALRLDESELQPPAGCLLHVAVRIVGDESRVTLWASEALGQSPEALLNTLRPGPSAALITTLPVGMGPMWRQSQGDRPRAVGSAHTALGESLVIALPVGADELERPGLEAHTQAALALAAEAGAKAASLAGRLPTRLNFGAGLHSPLPLTTGHALTIYAVVETTLEAMSRFELEPPLCVGVLGCGAIGLGALAALRRRVAVAEVQLCDRPEAAARLNRLAESLAAEGVRVSLRSRDQLDAPLILAATSEGGVWPAEALPVGCVLIDDSFPPAVPVEGAWARMDSAGDVIVLGGGLLTTAQPPALTPAPDLRSAAAAILPADPLGLPGCQWEALVLAARPGLPRITGPVTEPEASAYAEAARALGLVAAPLHLGARRFPLD